MTQLRPPRLLDPRSGKEEVGIFTDGQRTQAGKEPARGGSLGEGCTGLGEGAADEGDAFQDGRGGPCDGDHDRDQSDVSRWGRRGGEQRRDLIDSLGSEQTSQWNIYGCVGCFWCIGAATQLSEGARGKENGEVRPRRDWPVRQVRDVLANETLAVQLVDSCMTAVDQLLARGRWDG